MTARSCAELAELRSAYVDGALAHADRERLLHHLVDCVDCRRDVAELRHVRSLLTGSTDPGSTPDGLSHRLVSIAGDEATEPLWTRPFRRTPGSARLPSQRPAPWVKVVAGVLGCGVAALVILGIGYAAAPSESDLVAVEPTSQAIIEFTSVVSSSPLDTRVSAALHGRTPMRSGGGGQPTSLSLPAKQLSEAKASALLAQAGRAGDELTYSATQVVTLTRDDERLFNTVQVTSRGGMGTELSRNQPTGATALLGTHVDSDSSTRIADADLIDRVANRYELRGWKSQWYAGRSATVVEAVEPTADPPAGDLDGVVSRWWVDKDTALLLGQETYDGRGNRIVSSRVTDLRLAVDPDDVTAAQTSTPQTTATLTLSRTTELRRDGWICAERLAGLPLLRLRTDQTGDPNLVHLVYSDGVTSLSVVERRGRLAGGAPGSTHNETLGAWVTDGMPSTATWSSGDVVLTVVTDGSRETLAAAVAALPHQDRQQPTTMERVRAGWARILGR